MSAKIPAGEVSVVEPPAGKVVAVYLPTDSVRLHCERPGLLHPHARAAIRMSLTVTLFPETATLGVGMPERVVNH